MTISLLKKVFWPHLGVGRSFQILEIPAYSSGLKSAPALIWNQNPNLEMPSNYWHGAISLSGPRVAGPPLSANYWPAWAWWRQLDNRAIGAAIAGRWRGFGRPGACKARSTLRFYLHYCKIFFDELRICNKVLRCLDPSCPYLNPDPVVPPQDTAI